MTNFERWRFYNDSLESPDVFINWTWVLTVAAALQRRVCLFGTPNAERVTAQIYPNQYVVFIGPPGVGKTMAAREALQIFRSLAVTKVKDDGKTETTEVIKTGPSSITVQQLYRYLALNCTATNLSKVKPEAAAKGKVYIHSSLAFFCGSELGNLIENNDNGLVGFLTEAWECGDFHRETKTQGIDVIHRLCMTLLGAATPNWIREVTASRTLKQGFSARTIFIFADRKRKLTHKLVYTPEQLAARDALCKHVKDLTELFGECYFSPEADKFIEDWYMGGGARPINLDKRLEDYYERKKLHLWKLAMALHFSEHLTMEISLETVKRALEMLTSTELCMHKALSFGGENPIYNIAQEALRIIEQDLAAGKEHTTFRRILVELFDMGEQEKIQAAMQYLVDTNQIKQTQGMKSMLYEKIQQP